MGFFSGAIVGFHPILVSPPEDQVDALEAGRGRVCGENITIIGNGARRKLEFCEPLVRESSCGSRASTCNLSPFLSGDLRAKIQVSASWGSCWAGLVSALGRGNAGAVDTDKRQIPAS
jgi:hypothetical protein